jgi:hypothetical protein
MPTTPTARQSILAIAMAATIGLAACSGGGPAAQPSADPSSPPSPSAQPGASSDPGTGAGGGTTGGGSSAGDPGTGVGDVPPLNPQPIDPGAGQPKLVRPQPGRANPHPVVPIAVKASVDGRHVLVKLTWYGGVEPCSVLDSVRVERSGTDIALTPVEGSSDPNAICIEIALLKATIVDLGELGPGTYRILSPGSDAPPVEITID